MRGLFTFRRLAAVVVALVVTLFALIPAADAARETVTAGGLTATLSYRGTPPLSKSPYLRIDLRGKVIYSQTVRSAWCADECSPNVIAGARTVVHIVRLEPNGSPSVVLDLYSGGAHCCAIEQVYSLSQKSSRIQKAEYNFGNPGVRLVKLGAGGSFDLLSANDAFAYAFTDYAASGMPIKILSFSHNSFHDVTRSFPQLITKDADQWMSAFKSQASTHYADSVGLVAAWAADEDMLGRSASVMRFLDSEAKAGHLNSALSPITPSGESFVVALLKFLRAHGYAH